VSGGTKASPEEAGAGRDGEPPFDIAAYLTRIGYAGTVEPTLAVLAGLHRAHATSIPFENLDILLGRPIRLDVQSLQAKLVAARRGGYCFEQNSLFAAALRQIGFRLTTLAARVRLGATGVTARSHMLLTVDLDGQAHLADVGFGGERLFEPLPLVPGRPVEQYGRVYKLREEGNALVLQLRSGDSWHDLYAFTLEPQFTVDYEVANHYTSTHPQSFFVQRPYVQRTALDASYRVFGGELTVHRGPDVTSRQIASDEEMLAVLGETFGLSFPAGTRFLSPANRSSTSSPRS
jgi:N-hydroxyarylamine O-acetyltransferase